MSVFLKIEDADGDSYGAMLFFKNLDATDVYNEMRSEEVTKNLCCR